MLTRMFPSRTLAFYMGKAFVLRTFAVLAALLLILQTLDLLGASGRVLAHPGNGSPEIWYYISLRLPQLIARFLPFSVLLGTLITLSTLNQNSEIVSMKAAGLSAHQVLTPLFIASLGIAIISFAFNDRVVSRANATLTRWQKVDYGVLPTDRKAQVNVWVRQGDDLINAAVVNGSGAATQLETVTIYDRVGGSLKSMINAKSAHLAGDQWELQNVRQFDVTTGTVSNMPTMMFGKGIRSDQFTLAAVDSANHSFHSLWNAIGELKQAGRPTGALTAGLWHKISGPLSTLLMPLLGAVAGFGIARSGRLFVRAVTGMGLGFAYFVADNFGLAMGNLGAYPPLLAAWGPFFLFLLIGEAVLIHTEE
jgi:lipopolysaccharide export system permease protein